MVKTPCEDTVQMMIFLFTQHDEIYRDCSIASDLYDETTFSSFHDVGSPSVDQIALIQLMSKVQRRKFSLLFVVLHTPNKNETALIFSKGAFGLVFQMIFGCTVNTES